MRPHERRAAGAYPYWKLATWDVLSASWRDGRRAYASEAEAVAAASRPSAGAGPFRVSRVEEDGRRIDGEAFRPDGAAP